MAEKTAKPWSQAAIPLGDALLNGGSRAIVHGTGEALDAGVRAAKWLTGTGAPATGLTGRMSTAVGNVLAKPGVAPTMLATSVAAPYVADAFQKRTQSNEDTMTNMRRDTSRVITAEDVSVDKFLSKHASSLMGEKWKPPVGFGSVFGGGSGGGIPPAAGAGGASLPKSIGQVIGGGFTEGLGKGLGAELSSNIFGLGGRMARGIMSLFQDPQRKRVYQQVVQQDPVIHDAISKNPEMQTVVEEAYATMNRFAPTLALDLNAVRSFLREAVVMGGGVNYATIKNLVDTERTVAEAARGD